LIYIGLNHLGVLTVENQDILLGIAEHQKGLGHPVHHMEQEGQDQDHGMVKTHISQEEEVVVVVDQEDMEVALQEEAIIVEVSVAEAEVEVVVATMIAVEAVVEAALALAAAERIKINDHRILSNKLNRLINLRRESNLLTSDTKIWPL
jgi:hypothetical protein